MNVLTCRLFLSLSELCLMCWCFDGVVTFGLSRCALKTTDPVLEFHELPSYKLESSNSLTPRKPVCLERTIWLLILKLTSWIIKLGDESNLLLCFMLVIQIQVTANQTLCYTCLIFRALWNFLNFSSKSVSVSDAVCVFFISLTSQEWWLLLCWLTLVP